MPDSNNHVLHDELDRLELRLSEDIREIRTKINENGEAIVKLETLYGTLVKLPDTIESLKDTVVGINNNLQAMNNRMEQIQQSVTGQKETITNLQQDNKAQNEQIDRLDKKGKVDWIDFITENFWKIMLAAGALYVIIKDIVVI